MRELGNKIFDAYKTTQPADHQEITQEIKDKYEKEFTDSLIRGLRPEIEQKLTKGKNFIDTIHEAIAIERAIDAKNALRGKKAINPSQINVYKQYDFRGVKHVQNQPIICQICSKKGHSAINCFQRIPRDESKKLPESEAPISKSIPNAGEKNCRYCKKPGHVIEECRKRIYNEARKTGNQINQNTRPNEGQKNQFQENYRRPPRRDATQGGNQTEEHPVYHMLAEEVKDEEENSAEETSEELEWQL